MSQATRDYGNFPLQIPADYAGYYAKYLVNAVQWAPQEKLPEVAGKPYRRYWREKFLTRHRYPRGGCAGTPHKHFVSTVRGDARHGRLHRQGRKIFCLLICISRPHQQAVALAAVVMEQLEYQALPSTEIPVPKSLVIPIGTDILVRLVTDSVTLASPGKSYTYRPLLSDAEELNCGLALDFHFGDNADQDLRRKADFLRDLIDEPAFSTLRTKEQLGWVVPQEHHTWG